MAKAKELAAASATVLDNPSHCHGGT
jgi:hypothetical protein